MSERDREITAVVAREQGRLKAFIRKWVVDEADVEDVLQEVFSELVAAHDLAEPLRQAGAWLFRVARNRMVDLFRRRKSETLRLPLPSGSSEGAPPSLEELLPSPGPGPDAAYARRVLLEELDAALEELPEAQRSVFVAHELEGVSFRELSARTGIPVNTLLSRKHHAVLHLRKRLKAIYEEVIHV